MADTIREKIIQDIKDSLLGFTFTSLAGAGVYRGQMRFQEAIENPPVISILPREDEAAPHYGQTQCTFPVYISALAKKGSANESELAEAMHGELIEAAFDDEPTDAEKFEYVGGGVESYATELGQPFVVVTIQLSVEYFTDRGDPYTLTT